MEIASLLEFILTGEAVSKGPLATTYENGILA